MQYLIEFFKELDLLAPADPASTRRALSHVPVSEADVVVDAGCGTGRQTRQMLAEKDGHVIATDLELDLLTTLEHWSASSGFSDRLSVAQADMLALPVPESSLQMIYSEGAVYCVGIEAALTCWRALLKPGGYVCFSDAAYRTDRPPSKVREFWEAEYPGINSLECYKTLAVDCGYTPIDDFWMPGRGWDAYYDPLEERIDDLAPKWNIDEVAKEMLNSFRDEVDLYRTYGDSYGYCFLVLQKPHS